MHQRSSILKIALFLFVQILPSHASDDLSRQRIDAYNKFISSEPAICIYTQHIIGKREDKIKSDKNRTLAFEFLLSNNLISFTPRGEVKLTYLGKQKLIGSYAGERICFGSIRVNKELKSTGFSANRHGVEVSYAKFSLEIYDLPQWSNKLDVEKLVAHEKMLTGMIIICKMKPQFEVCKRGVPNDSNPEPVRAFFTFR